VAAVVDVETTGTNPDRDKIIEVGICLFEYERQSGRIYKVLGSWEWLEEPGLSTADPIMAAFDKRPGHLFEGALHVADVAKGQSVQSGQLGRSMREQNTWLTCKL
jgi:hypothetical protein